MYDLERLREREGVYERGRRLGYGLLDRDLERDLDSERGRYESPPPYRLAGGGVRLRPPGPGGPRAGSGGKRLRGGESGGRRERGAGWRRGDGGGEEISTESVAPSRRPVCMWVVAVRAAVAS